MLAYSSSSPMMYMYLPFSGPYWVDEGVRGISHLPRKAKYEVIALFVARMKGWGGRSLTEEEASLWNQCLSDFPECPIFRRLEPTPQVLKAMNECAEGTAGFFEAFCEDTEVGIKDQEYGLVEVVRRPKPSKAAKNVRSVK